MADAQNAALVKARNELRTRQRRLKVLRACFGLSAWNRASALYVSSIDQRLYLRSGSLAMNIPLAFIGSFNKIPRDMIVPTSVLFNGAVVEVKPQTGVVRRVTVRLPDGTRQWIDGPSGYALADPSFCVTPFIEIPVTKRVRTKDGCITFAELRRLGEQGYRWHAQYSAFFLLCGARPHSVLVPYFGKAGGAPPILVFRGPNAVCGWVTPKNA
jgi:hypothetical protein